MSNPLFKLDISADDKFFSVDHCRYECDGLVLIVNRGDEQFVFNTDYVKWFKAEQEEEDE